MIKQELSYKDIKEELRAKALDKSYNFILSEGRIRGNLIHAGYMMQEMRANHKLGILESYILGQFYIASCLMASSLKGEDRIQVKISCSGPIKSLSTEANALGEVRGYLYKNPLEIEKVPENFDLSPLFGAGFLNVTRHTKAARHPFSGQVELSRGNIAEDIAYYYKVSEQIPTAISLGIHFDNEGEIRGAGGLLLQAMPGAKEEDLIVVEEIISRMKGIGLSFAEGEKAEELIKSNFASLSPKIMDSRRVEFFCRCSKKQMMNYLKVLNAEDRKDIKKNGPFPLEICCHNCNSFYLFSKEEIKENL